MNLHRLLEITPKRTTNDEHIGAQLKMTFARQTIVGTDITDNAAQMIVSGDVNRFSAIGGDGLITKYFCYISNRAYR